MLNIAVLMQACVGAGVVVATVYLMKSLLVVFKYSHLLWRQLKVTRNMPGPPALPIVGNFMMVAGSHEEMGTKALHIIFSSHPRGPVLRFWFGPLLAVLLREPEDLEMLFTNPALADKFELTYSMFEPLLGSGLITLNGADHRRHRKAITPSLHLDILKDFLPLFVSNSKRFAKRLDALAQSGEVFDVGHLAGAVTNRTVCETLLSTDTTSLEAERDAFVESAHTGGQLMILRALRPWLYPHFLFRRSQFYEKWHKCESSMNNFVSKVLDRKLVDKKNNKNNPGPSTRRREAFLDHFLSSEDRHAISKAELFDELKTLVFAGSATSMDFFSFFFLTMAILPDVQKKVQRELDDILGSGDDDLLHSDLPHLEYLDRVIKETMRYFPPVPVYARTAKTDVKLPSGYMIPKGTAVAVLPLAVHRDEKFYPDPLKFDPDRFLKENSAGRHPYAYFPFSAGSRNCIGQRYAVMFAKTVFATVLRRFTFLPDPRGPQRLEDVELVPGISMSVRGGARVQVVRRDHCTPTLDVDVDINQNISNYDISKGDSVAQQLSFTSSLENAARRLTADR